MEKKKIVTLLVSDPGQVLIACHLRPFVAAGDGLLLCSKSTQQAVLSFETESQ